MTGVRILDVVDGCSGLKVVGVVFEQTFIKFSRTIMS